MYTVYEDNQLIESRKKKAYIKKIAEMLQNENRLQQNWLDRTPFSYSDGQYKLCTITIDIIYIKLKMIIDKVY